MHKGLDMTYDTPWVLPPLGLVAVSGAVTPQPRFCPSPVKDVRNSPPGLSSDQMTPRGPGHDSVALIPLLMARLQELESELQNKSAQSRWLPLGEPSVVEVRPSLWDLDNMMAEEPSDSLYASFPFSKCSDLKDPLRTDPPGWPQVDCPAQPEEEHSPPPTLPEEAEPELSVGSLGHPASCGKACRYVRRKTGCRFGAECTDCHLCIWQRKSVLCRATEEPPVPELKSDEDIGDAPTAGSVGHPETCGSGCKYHWKKGCKDGRRCTRCHLCGWKTSKSSAVNL